MIKGLFETHLYVRDLERSVTFYKNILGLEECHRDEKRNIVFFWVGAPQKFMLGIWQMPESELKPRHFAFECEPEWVINDSVSFLQEKNLSSYNFLNDGIRRPMVFAWMPAVSIYFNDPDGNVLEFIGILEGNAMPELGVITYDDWLNAAKNS